MIPLASVNRLSWQNQRSEQLHLERGPDISIDLSVTEKERLPGGGIHRRLIWLDIQLSLLYIQPIPKVGLTTSLFIMTFISSECYNR